MLRIRIKRNRSLHPATLQMELWFMLIWQLLLSLYVAPANGFSVAIGTIAGFDERFVSHRLQRSSRTKSKLTVPQNQQSLIQLCASLMDSNSSEPPQAMKQRQEQFTSRSVAATSILDDVQSQSMFPLQRLESNPSYLKLDQRDRSFARFLVTTTERRMGQIDKVLQLCQRSEESKKRKQKSDSLVDACLRIGACQILFAGVPSHAAVKETVDVLRMIPLIKVPEPKIKYVNAVLRKLDREGQAMLDEHTTAMDNITPWLMAAWRKDWGDSMAQTIADASMKQSPVFLSVKYPPNHGSDNDRQSRHTAAALDICHALGGTNTQTLPHGSVRVDEELTGAISDWPLYEEGLWWVQDASASLPAIALHNALSKLGNVSSMNVVDMCAAPGGKSAQLVSLGFNQVTAIEVSPRRSRRLVENLNRLQMHDKCTVQVQDGTEWVPDPSDVIQGVLVDAPCSATGTGSKRPDVLRRDSNLTELLEVQEKLACHCFETILKPGSFMVYATCSTLKLESEDQVEKLLRKYEGRLETVPFEKGEIKGFDDAIDKNGWMRVLPGARGGALEGCDGFFLARLKRIS